MEKINFRARVLIDDLNFLQNTMDSEFKDRMKMLIASYRTEGASYGIVSPVSPIISDSTIPLYVKASTNLNLQVSKGFFVVKTGDYGFLDTDASELILADATEGVINLVIAEFLLESTEPRPSIFDEVVIDVRQIRGYPISCVTLNQFNDGNIFPLSRKDQVVVLAAVHVYKDTTGAQQLFIDTSRDIYSYNGPWFSPVDIEHRSQLGSGVPTLRNVHGLAISDLTSGNLSVHQQFLSTGAIISKDYCVPNIGGLSCFETFSVASIFTDTTGAVTGVPNTKYVKATNYPKQVLYAYTNSVGQNKAALTIIENTNIIALSPYEIKEPVSVRYTYSKAVQPPTSLLNNTLLFGQPSPYEVAISNGKEYSTIENASVSFENSGPIPQRFQVFLNGDGNMSSSPKVILPAIKLDSMSVPYVFNSSLTDESKIVVGLTLAQLDCQVILRITGKNTNNTFVSEDITFDSTWSDSVIPSQVINENQFKTSVNYYNYINSIEVVSRTDDGNNSTIIVYADYLNSFYESLLICDVAWNGLGVESLRDRRRILPFVGEMPSVIEESPYLVPYFMNILDSTNYPINTQYKKLISEDFSQPHYIDASLTDFDSRQPEGVIQFVNSSLSADDFIIIATGKVLVAKASGANPNLGQFDMGASEDITKQNIIDTVNNTTFNSTVYAESESSNSVKLTASTNDYNFLISSGSAIPTAILVTGFKNGFLVEKAVKRDRWIKYLDTSLPTSNPELVANKYRSNAIPMPINTITRLYVIGFGVERFDLAICQVSYQTRSDVWQPKVTATSTTIPSCKIFTFTAPIAKISLEIFGKMKGISIFY